MTPDMTEMILGERDIECKIEQQSCHSVGKHLAYCRQGVGKHLASSKHTLGRLMSMLRVWLEYGWSMARVCLERLSVRSERTLGPTGADSWSVGGGLRALRYVVMIALLMVVGVNEMWGQIERNYTGMYYIANHNNNNYSPTVKTDNYYLCPSEVYYDWNASTPNQMPFLTTHKPDPTNRPLEPIAKWNIKYETTIDNIDYYYIKYVAPDGTEKYLVHNNIVISGKEARIRYHLQTDKDAEEDNNLFFFTAGYDANNKLYRAFIHICPKAEASRTKGASLNPAKANTDSYDGVNVSSAESWKQGSTTLYCGGLVGHFDLNDKTGVWFLEDIIERPVVSINSSGQAEITSSDVGSATYYYSTTGVPTTDSQYEYTDPIDVTNVETIKAIAKVGNEVSNVVTYTVGNGSPYLIQNQQCTAFYMVPGATESNNVTLNTSSVAGPKMEWYLRNAGATNGLHFYYIVNKSTGGFLYNSGTGTYPPIYVKSSDAIFPDEDAYKFYLLKNSDGSFNIYPKNVFGKAFHKDSENNSYKKVVVSPNLNDSYPQAHWKFISSNITDKKPLFAEYAPAITPTSASTGASYYYINNVGTSNSIIIQDGSSDDATTSSSGTNEAKSFMFVVAETDNWQTYYHIVSAATGKYMHSKRESSSTNNLDNAIEITNLPQDLTEEAAKQYQFVLARSTTADAYYIIPRSHYSTFTGYFYCLSDKNTGLKTQLERSTNSYKWTFEENTNLFCLNPIYKASGNKINITCPTIGTDIYYTTDGTDPTTSPTVYDNNNGLSSTEPCRIKAIAKLKNDASIVSDVVTLLNKPDVTVADGTYTYKGTAWEPTVTVSIGEGATITTAPTTPTATYNVTYSSDHTNVGKVTVTVADADANDNWYIWNDNEAHFIITPKDVTITAGSDSKTYNSLALTKSDFTATTLETGDTHTFNVAMTEGSTITDVGSTPNVIATVDGVAVTTGTATAVGNYMVTTADGTLTINPKAVTITANSFTRQYNGLPLTESGFITTSLESDDNHTFTVAMTSESTITDVGSTPNVIATVDGTAITTGTATAVGNYTVTTADGTLTITIATVTLTANSGTETYDGTEKTVTGFTYNVDGQTLTFPGVSASGSGTNAGTYDVTFTGVTLNTTMDATGNYVVTNTVNGTLTVNPAEVTLTANSRNTDVYDGTEKTVSGYTCNMDGLTFAEVSASRSETNAGTYEVTFSGVTVNTTTDDSGNYIVAEAIPGTLTINPKTLTITPNADQYKGFGESDPVITYTYNESQLVSGDVIGFNGALGREEGEDVGLYEITLGTLESTNTNYALAIVEGIYFRIKKSIGNGTIASGFTLEFGENTIILMDGETVLEEGSEKDYTVSAITTTESGRYSQRTFNGVGNYTGYFTLRNANVNFQNDGQDGIEWSATFVAEPAGAGAADNTKGHILPEGIRAFIITGIIGEWAIPEPLDYIPEGIPVLLISDKESGGFEVKNVNSSEVDGIASITSAQQTANMLKEVTTSTHFNAKTIYLLYKNEFVYNMDGDLAKGKVYLDPTTSTSPAPRLRINWDEVTRMTELQNNGITESQNDSWYTLDGRKLNRKPTQKGIYLVNGNKVIIR